MTTNDTARPPTQRITRRVRATLAALLVGSLLFADGLAGPTVAATDAPEPVAIGAPADQAEVEAALARLAADGMLFEDDGGVTDAGPLDLAKDFGKEYLHEAFYDGTKSVLYEALGALGYEVGGDDMSVITSALNDIKQSLARLEADVTEIKRKLEELLEGQDKTNFYTSYSAAGLAASRLGTAMSSVAGWIDAELEPSEENVSDIHSVVSMSLGELYFQTTNPVTGTIPLMMKATGSMGVIDLEEFYAEIDEARAQYRTQYAQGLAVLDMLLRWDTDGTIAVDLDIHTDMAVEATHNLYRYGLLPPQPIAGTYGDTPLDQPMIQTRGSSVMLSAPYDGDFRPRYTTWQHTSAAEVADSSPSSYYRIKPIEPMLRYMAEHYKPADHGGITLEQYLQERGMPTKWIYFDSFYTHDFYRNQSGLRRNYDTVVRARFGEIRGNDYIGTWEDIARLDYAWYQVWTLGNGWENRNRSKRDKFVYSETSSARHGARYQTSSWLSRFPGTAMTVISAPATNNVGGIAADFDAQRVIEAAFPKRTD
ncbi:MAG: hypothetical protein AAGA42_17370 [Actinomycetota bacterium]